MLTYNPEKDIIKHVRDNAQYVERDFSMRASHVRWKGKLFYAESPAQLVELISDREKERHHAMTVRELIDELERVEDKDRHVTFGGNAYGDTIVAVDADDAYCDTFDNSVELK